MADQAFIEKSSLTVVFKFLRLLKKKGVKVSQAILFGSYAKGRTNGDSDIDIAIVSRQFGVNNFKEMIFLRRLALKVDSRLEPVPLTPDDLEDHYSTLVQEIKRYGRILKNRF